MNCYTKLKTSRWKEVSNHEEKRRYQRLPDRTSRRADFEPEKWAPDPRRLHQQNGEIEKTHHPDRPISRQTNVSSGGYRGVHRRAEKESYALLEVPRSFRYRMRYRRSRVAASHAA